MAQVKRRYDATRRREQAHVRRLAVVLAARELFERDGFRATTLAAIAERGGISVVGLYKVFGSKAAIAKAVFDVAIAGDDEPVAISERPESEAVRAQQDPRVKIEMFADGLARRQAQSASVQILIRDGRHADESLEPVWHTLNEEALRGATMFAQHLSASAGVRDQAAVDRLRDVLWNLFAIDHYERLVLHRGWSQDEYVRWLADEMTAALDGAAGSRPSDGS